MVYFMAVRLLSTHLVSLAVLHFCKCCTWRDAKQKRPRLVNTVFCLHKIDHDLLTLFSAHTNKKDHDLLTLFLLTQKNTIC